MHDLRGLLLVLALFVVQVAVLAFLSRRRSAPGADEDLHFMPASWRSLPPVQCPLLIKVDGKVLRAHRITHIEHPDGDMSFVTDSGRELVGRFDWTYP